MPTYLFPDTNVFLHFKRPDEVDWRPLAGGDEVELVIVQPVLRELDKHKATNAVRRLKDRAAGAVKWLSTMAGSRGPTRIREGVTLSFRRSNPLVDFRTHRLREGILDDEIVASVLEFKAEHGESPILIVTGDVGMQVLAPGHGIDAIAPPEEYRLPEEPDPAEVEARRLRAQLAELQNRQPAPVIVFRDGGSRASVELPVVEQVSNEAIRRAVEETKWAAEAERPLLLGDDDDEAGFGYTRQQAHDMMVHRCEAKRGYMVALQAARDRRGRTIPLALLLENRGTAPATDIDIEFEVSGGRAEFSDSDGADPEDPFLSGPVRTPSHVGKPPAARSLEGTEEVAPAHFTTERLRYHFSSLKPSHSSRIAPLFVAFPSREQVRSFGLMYKVSHAEGAAAISGRLDVIVVVA